VLLNTISVAAQFYYNYPYQDATTKTPNNTPVNVGVFNGTDNTSTKKDSIKNMILKDYGNRIVFEAEATYKYNCHAYRLSPHLHPIILFPSGGEALGSITINLILRT